MGRIDLSTILQTLETWLARALLPALIVMMPLGFVFRLGITLKARQPTRKRKMTFTKKNLNEYKTCCPRPFTLYDNIKKKLREPKRIDYLYIYIKKA